MIHEQFKLTTSQAAFALNNIEEVALEPDEISAVKLKELVLQIMSRFFSGRFNKGIRAVILFCKETGDLIDLRRTTNFV